MDLGVPVLASRSYPDAVCRRSPTDQLFTFPDGGVTSQGGNHTNWGGERVAPPFVLKVIEDSRFAGLFQWSRTVPLCFVS